MIKPLRLLAEAQAEMTEAAFFLETQAPDLAFAFLAQIGRATAAIQAHPTAWPLFSGEYRAKSSSAFPICSSTRKNLMRSWFLPSPISIAVRATGSAG